MRNNLMEIFNKRMVESISEEYQNRAKDINGKFKFYYDNSYAVKIYSYFVKRGFNSKELWFKNGSKNIPMCSISSSARLCLLYFLKNHKDENFLLEQSYPIYKNDNNTVLTQAHPDAILKNTYYECKAQEVVKGENEKLKASYSNLDCFKELVDVNSIRKVKDELDFDMTSLGVNIKKKYYDLKLDVKQLICHLLAIAGETTKTNEKWVLKYLIFRPSRRFDEDVKEIYKELDYEFESILNSNTIKEFCKKYHISIEKEYVYIDDLDESLIDDLNN